MTAEDGALALAHEALRGKKFHEAEEHARRVLRRNPTCAPAICVLGSALSNRGDDIEAMRLFRQAIACDGQFAPAYYALSRRYYSTGLSDGAREMYRAWSRLEPSNPEVQHLAAAVTGENVPDRCSEAYVQAHFNQFADSFDDVLVKGLGYRGPEAVSVALSKYGSMTGPSMDVLDAGCGTGLCGVSVRPLCRSLVGVDLAERMVERARTRGCYDELVVADLCELMESRPNAFDAIVSSDVFIYFGALERGIASAHGALRQGGLLVITVEALHQGIEPYRLTASGRYAHRDSYLRTVISSAGFKLLSLEEECLRWELDRETMFYTLVSKKTLAL